MYENNTPKEEEEEAPVEDPKAYLTPDFFYDDEQIFKESSARTDFDTDFKLYNIFGIDLSHRYNSIPLNETTLIITAGNYAMFYDLVTGEERLILGHHELINCCAVHPNHEYVALGEAGKDPYLCIYHYPSLKLFRILKGGTEKAYTALNFSPDGKMLAAVGTYPDYMLTVWDWERETLILRAKAFSQDIYRVTFSDNLPGRLCTSGVGHIRLWEMARTFTGLKLQGEIGKFGNIEISDVPGYAMFPDGKVLSGSESGSLLLWEDALVKCEFIRQGGKRCHKGIVEVVYHKGQEVYTAGKDGNIRVWDFSAIDTAETEDTSVAIDLTQKAKLRLSKNSSIKCMYPVGSEFLVVDEKQGIWKADVKNNKAELIKKFHAGAIRALAFSPEGGIFVSGGEDGFIRLWTIEDKKMISELSFECGVTRILWPETQDGSQTIFVGFDDGCLRVIVITPEGLQLKQPLKPHTGPVRDIVLNGKLLATTGDDGALFFLLFENSNLSPLGFTYINGKKPRTKEEITQEAISGKKFQDDKEYARGLRIRWSSVIAIDCSDGTTASVSVPTSFPAEGSESFFIDMNVETIVNGAQDQDTTSILTLEEGEIKGTKQGVVNFGKYQRSVHSGAVTALAISKDKGYFCTGSELGELFMFKREKSNEEAKAPELKEIQVAAVEDIKEGDYSIEEEKQKSELDRRIKAAEQQKSLVRRQIETLRQKFSAILTQNSKAPSYMQLPSTAFKIDPFLYDLMEEQAQALEKEATRSTMFAAEKSRVHLRKVKSRLVRNMMDEAFTVTSTDGKREVTSFRVVELDPCVKEILEADTPQAELSEEENEDSQSEASVHNEVESLISEVSDPVKEEYVKPSRKNNFGRKKPLKKVVHTPDEHTLKRKKRDERRRKIMELKPPANYSDPQDLKNIDIAKKTIGDYKLKDDPDYIAPVADRMNATKKRKQLMQLVTAIQNLKITFNNKLKELAELKKKLQVSVDDTNRQLLEIRGTIGYDPLHDELIKIHEKRFEPLDLREKIEITVPTPEAVSFAEQVAAAARRRNEAQAGKQKQAQQTTIHRNTKRKQAQQPKKKKQADEGPKYTEIEQIEMSELSTELSYKRKILIANINKAIEKFNQKVEKLQEEKVEVQTEVVLAELRFILMLREFKLLAKLELKDAELNGKLRAKLNEIKAISNEVTQHTKQIAAKTHEIEESEKEVKGFIKRFHAEVPETHKYHDQLLRIFNFNMRRNQDKSNQDEEEIDLTMLDVEQVKKLFEKQNMEKEEDLCPQGCDEAIFNKVLDLREERMDVQDRITEAQNSKDLIQRQIDSIQNKSKVLQTNYQSILKEFEEFQHEKQHHLNELNFSLSIQFHQIKNLVAQGGDERNKAAVKTMPTDLSTSLVFTESGLDKLIKQVQKLRQDREKANQELKKDNEDFSKQKALYEELRKKQEDYNGKLADIQRLKFGENVDLVELEQMKVDKDADLIRAQTKEIEAEEGKEMEEMNKKIKEMTNRLTKEIQKNTAVLGALVELTENQRKIEGALQNSRKSQTAEDLSQDLELTDPSELLKVVEENNVVIEELEEEIGLLKRR